MRSGTHPARKLKRAQVLSRQTVRRRLAFHYTATHASRLNMLEIEIAVLRRQCLSRRIADREKLVSEIDAWERQRNDGGARIKWLFTTEKARTKMPRAYPQPEYERIPQAKESYLCAVVLVGLLVFGHRCLLRLTVSLCR